MNIRQVLNPWWAAFLIAVGLCAAVSGGLSLSLSHGSAVKNVVGLLAGVWLICEGMLTLRWRRTHSGRLRITRRFSEVLRGMDLASVYLTDGEDRVMLVHYAGHTRFPFWFGPLWYRWHHLMVVPEPEVDLATRALDAGQIATVVHELFELRSIFGITLVTRATEGIQARAKTDGEIEEVNAPEWNFWRAIRARYRGLKSGLLYATEAELRKACAQIAAARPLDHDDDEEDQP